ncbi:alpha/beta hydrolase [Kitasatospora kifunensis]|uniref:Pimeloyl-ACP methyl ester carboxylesterase n=1 Tax=Kitasatospora kifunensis TaxID=58351 RepID=A0A7W7R364_KITKI|nr:alpha/beta fold hydrolase [Kitasatospora kifunensis]MBB4924425.1 pimeloyl-ACP methyl ester carboxylesterase [Kitasatospora kifunensis]
MRRVVGWRVRPAGARAVLLILHGGQEASTVPASSWQPAAVRMRGFVAPLLRATAGRPPAVGLVRYRYQGWNGERADPAKDVVAALDAVVAELGPVPVVLLGHSMGGRAALRAAGHQAVTGVVALAPWCPPEDPCEQLAGRTLVTLHGDRDRVTDPAATVDFAARARLAGARVAGIEVAGGDHAMLRRSRDWHLAAARLSAALLGIRTVPPEVAAALELRGADQGGLRIPLPYSRRIINFGAPKAR